MEILLIIGLTLQTTRPCSLLHDGKFMMKICFQFQTSHLYKNTHKILLIPPFFTYLSEFYTCNNLFQYTFTVISLYAKHKLESFFFLFTSLALFASLFISIFDFFLLYQQQYLSILLPVCLIFVCLEKNLSSWQFSHFKLIISYLYS